MVPFLEAILLLMQRTTMNVLEGENSRRRGPVTPPAFSLLQSGMSVGVTLDRPGEQVMQKIYEYRHNTLISIQFRL